MKDSVEEYMGERGRWAVLLSKEKPDAREKDAMFARLTHLWYAMKPAEQVVAGSLSVARFH